MDEILDNEAVRHLLEECEKAMRLYAQVKDDPKVAPDIKAVTDALFRDLGRTVYNLYWTEPDVPADEQAVAIAEITSEQPTAEVEVRPRPVGSASGLADFDGAPEHTDLPGSPPSQRPADASAQRWYTDEETGEAVGLRFTAGDGLEEALPGEEPIPSSTPEDT